MNIIEATKLLREGQKIRKKGSANQNNSQWMGDKVSYRALHTWARTHKPKSLFCEMCGEVTNKLDCANISGKYRRDILDFKWLCRSCHMQEDGRIGNLKQYQINELNRIWDKKDEVVSS